MELFLWENHELMHPKEGSRRRMNLKSKWSRFDNRMIVYSILLFFIYLVFLIFFVFFWKGKWRTLFSPFGVDFGLFYAAGKMTLSGHVAQIFNVQAHHAVIEQVLNLKLSYFLPWLYPPIFLLVIIPFALLPFNVALLLWLGLTLALMIFAASRMLPKRKKMAIMLLGFPGIFLNFRWGQNGFLSAALLGFAIATMETSPVFSGVMIGLLAYKPQMAILPFFVLLVTKNWKALLSAMGTAVSVSLVSLLIFGKEVWFAFFQSLFQTSSSLTQASAEVTSAIQPSVLTSLIDMKVDSKISVAIQIIIALCAVVAVCRVFLHADRMTLKGSMLVLGIPLISPYFMQYDLVILALPLLLLLYDMMEYGYRKTEIVMLSVLWLFPLVNSTLAIFTNIQISPLVLIAEMVLVLLRMNRSKTIPAI